ncbi:hypothetical protein CTI14_62505, partial [Methylobacterium radiotolerans]
SQAETGCILADGKTVCGAQLPATRSPYGLNTGAMRNFLDPEQPEGGMGWAVLAVVTGTPVLMSQAETGCILADGKTVCGAQLPATRSPYGLNTG